MPNIRNNVPALAGRKAAACWVMLAVACASGCSGDGPGVEAPASDQRDNTVLEPGSEPPGEAASTPAETNGADGALPELSSIGESDFAGVALAGELGCSFAESSTEAPLLIAMGNVASSQAADGIVKIDDSIVRVSAPGGFDQMLAGGLFEGAAGTFSVRLTGPAQGDGESPPRPATLTYQRGDGVSRTYVGNWTCGP